MLVSEEIPLAVCVRMRAHRATYFSSESSSACAEAPVRLMVYFVRQGISCTSLLEFALSPVALRCTLFFLRRLATRLLRFLRRLLFPCRLLRLLLSHFLLHLLPPFSLPPLAREVILPPFLFSPLALLRRDLALELLSLVLLLPAQPPRSLCAFSLAPPSGSVHRPRETVSR